MYLPFYLLYVFLKYYVILLISQVKPYSEDNIIVQLDTQYHPVYVWQPFYPLEKLVRVHLELVCERLLWTSLQIEAAYKLSQMALYLTRNAG